MCSADWASQQQGIKPRMFIFFNGEIATCNTAMSVLWLFSVLSLVKAWAGKSLKSFSEHTLWE